MNKMNIHLSKTAWKELKEKRITTTQIITPIGTLSITIKRTDDEL
jgi:hypothetical protein